ncbi:MAG: DUF1269 domain-containing protein [Anaerolineae bacterium]
MDKMIVTVFETEEAAYKGSSALRELHENGDIVVYGMAVIAKDASGSVTIKQATGPAPWGTMGGMAVGAIVGLIAGPAGVAVGAATGALAGSLVDLADAGVGEDYVDEVSAQLEPGTTAVVAEVDEEWTTPVDTRMVALGGKVFRRSREDVVDAEIERDLTAIKADLAQAEAELEQADAQLKAALAETDAKVKADLAQADAKAQADLAQARANLQANVDADKARFQAARERAEARIKTLQQEADAKTKTLHEQAAKAQAERKAKLEARAAEIRADYEQRIVKLRQAMTMSQEANAMAREALKP